MEDVVRHRKIGTTAKAIKWTLKDGDGNPEDLSALLPAAITVQFQEVNASDNLVGAPFAGTGLFSFPVETFNAQNDVEDATDEINLPAHSLQTGDAVVYSNGGGTTIVGLVDGVTYYARRVDTTTITLHPTRQDALGDTLKLAIAPGLDQDHTLTSTGDNGVVLYPPSAADVGTVRDLLALVTVDFGGAATEKYPTGYRYILRVEPDFAQAGQ